MERETFIFIIILFLVILWMSKKNYTDWYRVSVGQIRGSTVWVNVNYVGRLRGSTARVNVICVGQLHARDACDSPHRGSAELRGAQPHVVPHLIVFGVIQCHCLRRVVTGLAPNARAALLFIIW